MFETPSEAAGCSDGGRGRFRVDSNEGGFPVDGLQSVVSSFRGRLDVVVLVVRESVAEPLVVQPLLPQAEVEHGECTITSDFLVHGQELWQSGDKRGSKINPEESFKTHLSLNSSLERVV